MASPNANWQLYVTGTMVGDAATPLVEQLALPEPVSGRQWLLLKLTLENISDTWLALPSGGISGGLLDSEGSDSSGRVGSRPIIRINGTNETPPWASKIDKFWLNPTDD